MKLTLMSALTAHRAHEKTVEMLNHDTLDFISPLQWPPSGPDLKLVDYAIWGKLQKRVYCTQIRDVDHLVTRLMEELCRFDHEIISPATQWRGRLHACMKADGGHFEHFIRIIDE